MSPLKINPFTLEDAESVDNIGLRKEGSAPKLRVKVLVLSDFGALHPDKINIPLIMVMKRYLLRWWIWFFPS